MKKEMSNYQCQDMYGYHYMISNTRNQNDRRTHNTPGHNPFMERNIIYYQKNNQLKNWMKIIRKYFRKL